ncbi:DUF4255 domain-containing protein [Streptomyces sp. SCA3-4]|uniref:DUF4255 domain-containing protein n=1 Tax=Streptomyces sichuanensis TaxID=2871810 RepID=UPI001CE3347C|nr:DUF4255 domain-containing protein [Streptomyces sichuanensis]MCA6091961.1 DUF4255 domain-containing protein [Streptomyces sichuanensis]
MIDIVDKALEQRVKQDLKPIECPVDFRPPSAGKEPGRTMGTETVGIYLHDIREDLDRRQTGLVQHYGVPDGYPPGKPVKTAYHDPPRYARLSYLITAWAPDPRASHHMLGRLLTGLSTDREFELDLPVELEDMGLCALLEVGRPPVHDRALQELWSAVGHALVPALHVTVTVPLLTFVVEPYEHWVTEPLVLDVELPRADPPPQGEKWPPREEGDTPS